MTLISPITVDTYIQCVLHNIVPYMQIFWRIKYFVGYIFMEGNFLGSRYNTYPQKFIDHKNSGPIAAVEVTLLECDKVFCVRGYHIYKDI